MREPIKVLYFVDRMLRGGIQSLVVDWVSRFDKDKIQVDFLLLDDGNKYELEDTLAGLGCKVFKLSGIWVRQPLDFIKEAKKLDDFFRIHHDYKVVHLHSSSKNYMVLKYAKKYGIPIRIAHSHNIDFQTQNPIKKIVGNLLKPKLIKYSTDYFACSEIAGQWLFGKKITNSNSFKLVNNAVDYERFKYDKAKRKIIRKELNVDKDTLVIGNVGRFTEQKNHRFLIDIFYEINKNNKNSLLLLIGQGPLMDEIKAKVKLLDLEEKVIFLGFKENVNDYMQAMDCFLFPSLFEGLGLVLIEAQCSGLYCITSKNVVPKEAQVLPSFCFIDLKSPIDVWVKEVLSTNNKRISSKKYIKKTGYLIDDIIDFLTDFYISK